MIVGLSERERTTTPTVCRPIDVLGFSVSVHVRGSRTWLLPCPYLTSSHGPANCWADGPSGIGCEGHCARFAFSTHVPPKKEEATAVQSAPVGLANHICQWWWPLSDQLKYLQTRQWCCG